jgi:hypothetical protein
VRRCEWCFEELIQKPGEIPSRFEKNIALLGGLMRLLTDKQQILDTGMKQPFYGKASCVQTDTNVTEMSFGHGQYSNQTKWQLRLAIAIEFFANQAQYREALKGAQECIQKEIFRDSHMYIAYIRKAIMDQDTDMAFKWLSLLQKEIEE